MTIQEKAAKIMELIGGERNVKAFTHCITRLRFNLLNDNNANLDEIRKMEGILDVQVQGGQTQVIIGGEVGKVYREILKQYPGLDKDNSESGSGGKKSLFNNILDTLSSILVPSLAPVVGGGMLKGFLYLLVQIKAMDAAGDTYAILNIASDCMFYFFPFLLAVSSAKRFRTNEYMALSLAGALMYPTIIAAVGGENFLFLGFIPITAYSYASSVLPIILGVWIMSYIYRFFEKIIPSMVSIIFAPLSTLVITIPIVLAGIGPIGYFVGEYIAIGIDKIINFAPWLAGFLVAASRPFLVLCGMHHAIRPLTIQQISTYGYSTISAMNFMSTMAQATAAFAIFVLTKNKNSKQIAASSTVSGYFGITEPALYGIIVKYKSAMIGTLLGGGIGGLIATVLGARAYASAMPSILSIPVFFGEGFIGFVIGLIATIVSTFIIIIFLGKSVLRAELKEGTAEIPTAEKRQA